MRFQTRVIRVLSVLTLCGLTLGGGPALTANNPRLNPQHLKDTFRVGRARERDSLQD